MEDEAGLIRGQLEETAGALDPVLDTAVGEGFTFRDRLVLFKWRYVLQADGLAPAQARRLTFLRWMYLQRRVSEYPHESDYSAPETISSASQFLQGAVANL
jgi:hypothetical protein